MNLKCRKHEENYALIMPQQSFVMIKKKSFMELTSTPQASASENVHGSDCTSHL